MPSSDAPSNSGPAVALAPALRLNETAADASQSARAESCATQGALRLAAALLGYGLPVFRVEEALARLTGALGVQLQSLGLPRALMVNVRDEHGSRSVHVPAESGVVDLDRLSSLHALVGEVERGQLPATAVGRQVARVLDAPPHYPAWAVVLASSLCGWGAAPLLGGRLVDANAAAVLGLLVGLLLWSAAARSTLALVLPVVAGLVVSAGAVGLAPTFGLAGAVVLAAALLPLLPGLSITVAMMELGAGHSVCGTSRLVSAGTVLLQLGFGALVGARVGGKLHVPAELPDVTSTPHWLLACAVPVLSLGVGVLVQVRRSDMAWALAISVVAFLTSRMASGPYGPEVGALVSATVVALLSNAFARYFDRPASVLLVPGVLMLVPGCLGLLSLSALAGPAPVAAVATSSQVMMVATALSLGVLLATTAFPARSSL